MLKIMFSPLKLGQDSQKGLRQKIVITLREKSSLCKNFVIKLRLFLLGQNGIHKKS